MMRISLIGAGSIKYHFEELLGIPEEEFRKHIDAIANVLAGSDVELVLLPDRGTNFELVKQYKRCGGKKVIGLVPMKDNDFGIGHLKPYLEAEIEGKKIIDETIDAGDWFRLDLSYCIFGDAILMLGCSLGVMRELASGFYLYKLLRGQKEEVSIMREKIHPQARAGAGFPLSVIIYRPFLKGNALSFEMEKYIQKTGGRIMYIDKPEDLEIALDELSYKGSSQ